VVKRLSPDVELKANVQYEQWLIPLYKSGRQSDTSTAVQLTWYPKIAAASLVAHDGWPADRQTMRQMSGVFGRIP
jgi:hypothetical protein